MSTNNKLTTVAGAPVADNQNVATAGRRGPMTVAENLWFLRSYRTSTVK